MNKHSLALQLNWIWQNTFNLICDICIFSIEQDLNCQKILSRHSATRRIFIFWSGERTPLNAPYIINLKEVFVFQTRYWTECECHKIIQSCKLSSSTFSCQTVNFLTNEILWTILSSQLKSEKSYWQCSRHFEYNSLCLRQVCGLFSPHLLPEFDHFGVLLL